MYADDLLVSDSNFEMQCILKIIEQYCNKMEIKINCNKTPYIQIGPKSPRLLVSLFFDPVKGLVN